MPFGPKTWHDYPNTTTPITAAALEDLETRLGAYTDTGDSTSVSTSEGYTDTRIGDIVALGNVGANWQGTWSSGTTYAKGAGVARNALLYVAVQGSNTNHDPATDTTATWWAPLTKNVGIGIDVWASQSTPASVTDWGTIINTLISGGARRLLFSEHDFPITTKIDLTSIFNNGVVFQGAGGGQGWNRPEHTPTRLIWKNGAGSGYAIDFNTSDAITFRDLSVIYDNSAYNGDLINANSSGSRFFNCSLGSSDRTSIRSARSILRLESAVGVAAKDCTIYGAATPVRGHETASTVSNQITFEDCTFMAFGTGAVANAGQDWNFRACCWEFDFSPTNAQAFITDVTPNDDASVRCTDGCTFWDYSNTGQGIIKTLAAHTKNFYFTLRDASVHSGSIMSFLAPGGVELDNVKDLGAIPYPAAPAIDFGTSAGGGAKEWIIVNMPVTDTNGTGDPTRAFANLDGGHNFIHVNGKTLAGISRACRTLAGHERVQMGPSGGRPTVAMSAGQSGLTLTVIGNEYKGVVKISGTVVAGTICRVTFAQPLITGFTPWQHILLGAPLKKWNGETFDVAPFYTSQISGQQLSQTDLTAFEINCEAGWTSKQIAVPYVVAAVMT